MDVVSVDDAAHQRLAERVGELVYQRFLAAHHHRNHPARGERLRQEVELPEHVLLEEVGLVNEEERSRSALPYRGIAVGYLLQHHGLLAGPGVDVHAVGA